MKKISKDIAEERVNILISSALEEVKDSEQTAQLQADTAKNIAMHFRIRMGYRTKQFFCKKCKSFIVPGLSARVRVGRSRVRAIRVTCLKCKNTYRKVLPQKTIKGRATGN